MLRSHFCPAQRPSPQLATQLQTWPRMLEARGVQLKAIKDITVKEVAADDASVQVNLANKLIASLEESLKQPKLTLAKFIMEGDLNHDVQTIHKLFSFSHCGLVLNASDSDELLHSLEQQGYELSQRFPSTILAGILRQAYQRPFVDIEVMKLFKKDIMLELFCVKEGLSRDEVIHECKDRSHLALGPRTTNVEDSHTFIEIMGRNGLSLTGSGINHQEKAIDADGNEVKGVTVLYFEAASTWSGIIQRLEMCIPGVHKELLDKASQCAS